MGAEPGLTATHRRYVPHSRAHYGGGLVDGAYLLGLFGDVATELCIRGDGDEGLLAGYREVRFSAPVRVGDVLEVTGTLVRVGRRSRDVRLRRGSCAGPRRNVGRRRRRCSPSRSPSRKRSRRSLCQNAATRRATRREIGRKPCLVRKGRAAF